MFLSNELGNKGARKKVVYCRMVVFAKGYGGGGDLILKDMFTSFLRVFKLQLCTKTLFL